MYIEFWIMLNVLLLIKNFILLENELQNKVINFNTVIKYIQLINFLLKYFNIFIT